MSFLAELKRRNVFRVGIAYAVGGWLLLQFTDVLSELLSLPDTFGPVVVAIVAIGFPIALFFAWAFELTPEGIKRENEVDRSQSITPQTGRKLNNAIVVLLLLAVAYLLFDKFSGSEPFPGEPAEQAAATNEMKRALTKDAEPAPDSTPVISDQSIAVLPFVNMSEDTGNEYFSDGLSEELLNLLAKVPQLHVAARTSSFQFKGQSGDIADIAEQLKVAHILEGSVRKSGNQVRITAQLIRADNGYHMWSETYDRTLDNIFQIQDEIAGAVVDALKVTLLGESPRVVEADPAAYALFLQGRYLFNQRGEEPFARAATAFRQALDIDPDYAAAWAGLAETLANQTGYGFIEFESGLEKTRSAIQTALKLDPNLAAAWVTLGRIQVVYDWNWTGALASIDKALELEPGNADALNGAADVHGRLGLFQEALELWQRALDHDPLNLFSLSNLATARELLGDLDGAEQALNRLFELNPTYPSIHVSRSWIFQRQGRLQEALAEVERQEDNGWKITQKVFVLYTLGREDESTQLLTKFKNTYDSFWSYQLAQMQAWRGDIDEAFATLDIAFEVRDTGLSGLLADSSFFRLHSDPRWTALLDRMGLLPYWNDMPDRFKGRLP